ncbi:hypothetical protein KR074_000151, partial [Drosophila pseudoananassae]
SKHSRESFSSSEGHEDRQSDPISNEPEALQCRSHLSQRSTDGSMSFSQIYSEIYEESKEREKKAERACRNYHINKLKLHRNQDRSESGSVAYEGENGSLGSQNSSYSARTSREYESRSMEDLDFESFVRDQQRSIVGYQDRESLRSERSSFKRLIASEWEESIPEDKELEIDVRSSFTSSRRVSRHSRDSLRSTMESQGSNSADKTRVSRRSSFRKSDHKYSERSSSRQQVYSERGKSSGYTRSTKTNSVSLLPEEEIEYEDYKSQRSTTSASLRSECEEDYLPSSSTRHRHHHHYRRLQGEPKTYQDRGNSPINIKTSRHSSEMQEPEEDFEYEGESSLGSSHEFHDISMGRSSNSVGVQYPSEDEEEAPYTEGGESYFSEQPENLEKTPTWHTDGMESNISEQHENNPTNLVYSKCDQAMSTEESVKSELPQSLNNDYDENISAYEEPSQNPINAVYSECDQVISTEESVKSELPQSLNDDYDESISAYEGASQNPTTSVYSECDQVISTEESVKSELPQEVVEPVPKNGFNLRIYNADEALMIMPENYKGPAIILDDDAEFLDISLTDDEEKIRAKLMAAALTTKRNSSSRRPDSSSPKTSDSPYSIHPRIGSYRPSVIFSRRSEEDEEDPPPRPKTRISLLAEQTLRHCSQNYTNVMPLKIREVPNTLSLDEWNGTSRLITDRQSLAKEFNKKFNRQLKIVAESFQ